MLTKLKQYLINQVSGQWEDVPLDQIWFGGPFRYKRVTDVKPFSIGKWKKEHIDLYNHILLNGFQHKIKDYVILSKDNICINGHHRIQIMVYLGRDKVIRVRKLNIGWGKSLLFAILLSFFKPYDLNE